MDVARARVLLQRGDPRELHRSAHDPFSQRRHGLHPVQERNCDGNAANSPDVALLPHLFVAKSLHAELALLTYGARGVETDVIQCGDFADFGGGRRVCGDSSHGGTR